MWGGGRECARKQWNFPVCPLKLDFAKNDYVFVVRIGVMIIIFQHACGNGMQTKNWYFMWLAHCNITSQMGSYQCTTAKRGVQYANN